MRFATLASGSSGNVLYIETDEAKILVDGGLSARSIVAGLDQLGVAAQELDAILVSHEHKDHIKGVGTLARRFSLPVYASEGTWEAMGDALGCLREEQREYLVPGKSLELGDLQGEVISTSHDAQDGIGFCFQQGPHQLGVLTDTGKVTSSMASKLRGCQGYVFEANHDEKLLWEGSYPYYLKRRVAGQLGHLSNRQSGEALSGLATGGTAIVLLAHLSLDNNRPEVALNTVAEILERKGFALGPGGLRLSVAPRHHLHPVVDLTEEVC